jgi:hypothetical protein
MLQGHVVVFPREALGKAVGRHASDFVSGDAHARDRISAEDLGRPVQFELFEPPRTSISAWLERRGARSTTAAKMEPRP